MFKNLVIIVLVLLLSLGEVGTKAYAVQIISPWAQTPFKVMKERGLIPETLREDENMREEITREEFAELVTTYFIQFKPQTIEGEEVFTDTLSPLVQLAGRLGIVKGTGEGKFSPYEKLTREQASTMFMRVEKMIEEGLEITRENRFKDKEEISEWAKEGVSTMSKEGVIKGYPDGRFRPKKAMTKEEGIVVVARMAKKHGIITFEENEGEQQPTKAEEGKDLAVKPEGDLYIAHITGEKPKTAVRVDFRMKSDFNKYKENFILNYKNINQVITLHFHFGKLVA
ncbi:S-layer homology domain-containing protein [Tepidibacter thalassicus]|uniref:S-layer homology domain-containing protein n=1 Tax=Tepidibacter thalassicus DSM 15285 TaxID=1123350 RepID=A0A1M5SVS9_9FIRM|nr:S-layer homology domain-containing protein [Tepidibacter thalassicus]SHH42318.1 S-layer homology domain-containing protein [Tepidibacter thalassicus DSM 15285]SHH42378.1 S-layer homology domain-containing protein [Tepidibacter thalassicus DSM 15285]